MIGDHQMIEAFDKKLVPRKKEYWRCDEYRCFNRLGLIDKPDVYRDIQIDKFQ